jgi:hypothetical protein
MQMGTELTFGRYGVVTTINAHILAACVVTPRVLQSECGRFGGTTAKK